MNPGRMPRPTEEQESLRAQARRRLIGAVVVMAVLIVLAPLALDGEGPVNDDIAVRMPTVFGPDASAPANDASPGMPSAVRPISRAPAHSATADAQFALPPQVAEARRQQLEKPANAEALAPHVAAPAVAPMPGTRIEAMPTEAVKSPPAAKPASGYVVQVGVFGQRDNARAMVARLNLAGVGAYSDSVRVGQGEALRVRAGPYATREAAEQALSRMSAAGVPGVIRGIEP
jgi:DedD protein